MNCQKCKEELMAYLEGLLEDAVKKDIESHLAECDSCRHELSQLEGLHKRLVDNGGHYTNVDLENAVMDRIVREQSFKLREIEKNADRTRIWRLIMKSNITKLAVAAAIIIAALVALNIINVGNSGGIALAKVLERVNQVQAFVYRMSMTMTGDAAAGMHGGTRNVDSTILVSDQNGMRMETITNITPEQTIYQKTFLLPAEKSMTILMPDQKKYVQVTLDDTLLEQIKSENKDPRETLKRMLSSEYTELGRSEINGIEVEGFQTTDPAFAEGLAENIDVTLWVDAKTWFPVQYDLSIRVNEQTAIEAVLDGFQWDVQVTAEDFQVEIPDDYESIGGPGGIELSGMDMETTIKGLRVFSELSGRYPAKIDLMSIGIEFGKVVENNREALRERMKDYSDQEGMAVMTKEIISPVQSIGVFYAQLTKDGKEPVYYGQTVTPGDGTALLMRWKESEGQYTVIYGDLTVETVTAEQLAELEPAGQ